MKRQTIEGFTDWFCKEFQVEKQDLVSKSRTQGVTFLRHCYCAMARKQGFTYQKIGESIGRDHTTIMSSVDRHLELIHDKSYRRTIGKKVMI